ncbi:MAG TPA: hypothetical protein VFQ61_39430 [Polyangiaceae bacterium]|nr:hypothetical protein [Polyangiaceae bacterium]
MSFKSRTAQPAAALLALGMLLTRTARAKDSKLLVYLHVPLKQRALQSALQGALPGHTVLAVGRMSDFERSLGEGPDAVLTLPMVLTAHGLSARLQGHRQGAPNERYALVAVDVAPTPSAVHTVGVLDLLGRDATTSFVHALIGAKPKVERVTKLEDLLPMLQMQRVDAILLPARFVADLKEVSRLDLAYRELPTGVGLPALAGVDGRGEELAASVAKFPLKLSKLLGVDEWR